MSEFDLSQSRLLASVIGMDKVDDRHFVTLAATLQALHVHALTWTSGARR